MITRTITSFTLCLALLFSPQRGYSQPFVIPEQSRLERVQACFSSQDQPRSKIQVEKWISNYIESTQTTEQDDLLCAIREASFYLPGDPTYLKSLQSIQHRLRHSEAVHTDEETARLLDLAYELQREWEFRYLSVLMNQRRTENSRMFAVTTLGLSAAVAILGIFSLRKSSTQVKAQIQSVKDSFRFFRTLFVQPSITAGGLYGATVSTQTLHHLSSSPKDSTSLPPAPAEIIQVSDHSADQNILWLKAQVKEHQKMLQSLSNVTGIFLALAGVKAAASAVLIEPSITPVDGIAALSFFIAESFLLYHGVDQLSEMGYMLLDYTPEQYIQNLDRSRNSLLDALVLDMSAKIRYSRTRQLEQDAVAFLNYSYQHLTAELYETGIEYTEQCRLISSKASAERLKQKTIQEISEQKDAWHSKNASRQFNQIRFRSLLRNSEESRHQELDSAPAYTRTEFEKLAERLVSEYRSLSSSSVSWSTFLSQKDTAIIHSLSHEFLESPIYPRANRAVLEAASFLLSSNDFRVSRSGKRLLQTLRQYEDQVSSFTHFIADHPPCWMNSLPGENR